MVVVVRVARGCCPPLSDKHCRALPVLPRASPTLCGGISCCHLRLETRRRQGKVAGCALQQVAATGESGVSSTRHLLRGRMDNQLGGASFMKGVSRKLDSALRSGLWFVSSFHVTPLVEAIFCATSPRTLGLFLINTARQGLCGLSRDFLMASSPVLQQ